MKIPSLPRLLILGLASGLALSPLPLPAAEAATYEIALLGQQLAPPAGVDRGLLEQAFAAAEGTGKAHFLVQLYAVPGESERNDLWRRGVELGGYVAGNAWMAAVPADRIRSLASFSEVRWAMPWTAEHKQHPRVKAGDFGAWTRDRLRPEWVMLFVTLHRDVPLERIHPIAERAGGAAMPPLESVHGATVWLPESRLRELAANEEILWIEEGPMPLGINNDGVRAASRAQPVLTVPYGLDGSGVKLFVYDGGTVRIHHETFTGPSGFRAFTIDAQPIDDHPTHVAGTAIGDGSGSPGGRGRGIATGAVAFSAGYEQIGAGMSFWDNAGDVEADFALARSVYHADLANISLGSNTANNGYDCSREGDYSFTSTLIDGIVAGQGTDVRDPMILVWSAGNERNASTPKARCGGNYATTAPPACAKNPIHVGVVNSDGLSMTNLSSWGPCDDGRLKPTLVAPGCEQGRVTGEVGVYSSLAGSDSQYGAGQIGSGFYCGTSMAAPAVSGIVSLFLEDWRAITGTSTQRPLPALVKAFLIHTARDLGPAGPDYQHGYGAVDAKALIDALRAGNGSLAASSAPAVWGKGEIEHGEVQDHHYSVAPGTAVLKASLAWDDPAAAAFAAGALVNDLTLQLIGPGGVVHDAFVLNPAIPEAEATTGLNTRDNQEQVIVHNPAPGRWTVRIVGTNIPQGAQTYGLVYSQKAKAYDPATCLSEKADFETGTDIFNLSGATRAAAPIPGHGAFSLQLGGVGGTTHEAVRVFCIPNTATRAALTYHVSLATLEKPTFPGLGYDYFTTEIRDPAGTVLAVVDNRNDASKTGVWLRQFEVDLTPWRGTTLSVVFRMINDPLRPTTFWVDDLEVESCSPAQP